MAGDVGEAEGPSGVLVRELLVDGNRRARMGMEAAHFIASERSVESAAIILDRVLSAFTPKAKKVGSKVGNS